MPSAPKRPGRRGPGGPHGLKPKPMPKPQPGAFARTGVTPPAGRRNVGGPHDAMKTREAARTAEQDSRDLLNKIMEDKDAPVDPKLHDAQTPRRLAERNSQPSKKARDLPKDHQLPNAGARGTVASAVIYVGRTLKAIGQGLIGVKPGLRIFFARGNKTSTPRELPVKAEKPHYKGYVASKVRFSDAEINLLTGRIKKENEQAVFETARDDLHITLIDKPDLDFMVKAVIAEGAKNGETISKSKAIKFVKEHVKEHLKNNPPEGKPIIDGLGSATDAQAGHTAYFATVRWPEIRAWRQTLAKKIGVKEGLKDKDLHITLSSTAEKNGKPIDVHGFAKKPNVIRFAKPEQQAAVRQEVSQAIQVSSEPQIRRLEDLTAEQPRKPGEKPTAYLNKLMQPGDILSFVSVREVKTEDGPNKQIRETNYIFREAAVPGGEAKIYIIPEWLVKSKVENHEARGSKFTEPKEVILQGIADGVNTKCIREIEGEHGKQELSVEADAPIGLDNIITEAQRVERGLGEPVEILQELDSVSRVVTRDYDATNILNAVFFPANPKYAEGIPAALEAQLGIPKPKEGESSWTGADIHIAVTAYPGKPMPARTNAKAWADRHTLIPEAHLEAVTTARAKLTAEGIWEPLMTVRESIKQGDMKGINEALTAEILSSRNVPDSYKKKIEKLERDLSEELSKAEPNERDVKNAKLKLLSFAEAALLRKADLDPTHPSVEPGLLSQHGTKEAYKELREGEITPLRETAAPAAKETSGQLPENFQSLIDKALRDIPSEHRDTAKKEIDRVTAEIPVDAKPREIGKILGPAIKAIKRQFGDTKSNAQRKLTDAHSKLKERDILSAENVEKLTAAEAENINLLCEHGVLTKADASLLNNYLNTPGTRPVITEALKVASGQIRKKGDVVAAYTHFQGYMFELSRRDATAKILGTSLEAQASIPTEAVTYNGVKIVKSSNGDATQQVNGFKTKESKIQNDVPALDGHVYEVKRYPRRSYGEGSYHLWELLSGQTPSGEIPRSLVTQYNQAVKYQAALDQLGSRFKGASIEVRGFVDKGFIALLHERAPDVEILYNLRLPEGQEVVFRIKQAGHDRASLRRRPDFNTLTAQEKGIIDGLRKSIEDGSIHDLFKKDILTEADIKACGSPYAKKILEAGLDPMKIKDVQVLREYEQLVLQKQYDLLIEKSNSVPTRRENLYSEPLMPERIDAMWETVQAQIAESNLVVQKTYSLRNEAEGQAIKAEFINRLKWVAKHEYGRVTREELAGVHARRVAKGYRGPKEGYVLDPLHIYMDALKGVRAQQVQQGKKKKGKNKKAPVKSQYASPERRYDDFAERFKTATAAEVAKDINNGKYTHVRKFVEVRYPLEAVVDKGNMQILDVTEAKTRKKLEADIFDQNLKRMIRLSEDPSTPQKVRKALDNEMNRSAIDRARAAYDAEYSAMVREIQSEVQRAREAKDKPNVKPIRDKWEPIVQARRKALLDAYKKALGNKYRDYETRIERDFEENRVKFIYVITADGKGTLVREAMEPGSERPTHSELAGGQNIYAAGEIYIQDGVVTVINNGSGHYRPDAAETVAYVKNILIENGFILSENLKLEQVKFPFVPFDGFDSPHTISPFMQQAVGQ